MASSRFDCLRPLWGSGAATGAARRLEICRISGFLPSRRSYPSRISQHTLQSIHSNKTQIQILNCKLDIQTPLHDTGRCGLDRAAPTERLLCTSGALLVPGQRSASARSVVSAGERPSLTITTLQTDLSN